MSYLIRGCCLVIGLMLCVAASLLAQEPKARQTDVVKTDVGDLKITPINHASLLLEWSGIAIYVDPTSQGDYTGLPKANLILITDIHGDHMDPKAVAALKREGKPETLIFAPEAVGKTIGDAVILKNGERRGVAGLAIGGTMAIEAVPMYNLTRGPASGQLYHPKGRGNGYILTLGRMRPRIYIAGDTECIPEMKALKTIDVAFMCMNLPYTQTPQEAAECVKAFRPAIVYPYHYRGQDPKVFADALKDEKGIEVRLRNWY
jgi:L-ascorbate metabolism protein UlaG (beta-lactamase superfamily)